MPASARGSVPSVSIGVHPWLLNSGLGLRVQKHGRKHNETPANHTAGFTIVEALIVGVTLLVKASRPSRWQWGLTDAPSRPRCAAMVRGSPKSKSLTSPRGSANHPPELTARFPLVYAVGESPEVKPPATWRSVEHLSPGRSRTQLAELASLARP